VLRTEEDYIISLFHGKEGIDWLEPPPLALIDVALNVPIKFPVTSNLMSQLLVGDGSSLLQRNTNNERVKIERTLRYFCGFIVFFYRMFHTKMLAS